MPYTGLYLFIVNVVAWINNPYVRVQIVHENQDLLGTYASSDGVSGATASVVTPCNVGEIVWVRCDEDFGYMYGGPERWSHFSGALLQAYN